PDGRAWLVHSAEAPTPQDVSRVRKASAATVPLGLALPLQPEDNGVIYAGLPLAETSVPLRANAQFDPVTSPNGTGADSMEQRDAAAACRSLGRGGRGSLPRDARRSVE